MKKVLIGCTILLSAVALQAGAATLDVCQQLANTCLNVQDQTGSIKIVSISKIVPTATSGHYGARGLVPASLGVIPLDGSCDAKNLLIGRMSVSGTNYFTHESAYLQAADVSDSNSQLTLIDVKGHIGDDVIPPQNVSAHPCS